MMTKQEERNILNQIAKLITEAGEDSYIGMAFEGCVHMARENIDNDWGNSPLASLEIANVQNEKLTADLGRAEDEITNLQRALSRKQDELDELRNKLKAERKKQLPADLYRDLWLLVDGIERQAIQEIEKTAEILSYCADEPTDIAVAAGLKRLQQEHQRKSHATRLLAELEKYEPKN